MSFKSFIKKVGHVLAKPVGLSARIGGAAGGFLLGGPQGALTGYGLGDKIGNIEEDALAGRNIKKNLKSNLIGGAVAGAGMYGAYRGRMPNTLRSPSGMSGGPTIQNDVSGGGFWDNLEGVPGGGGGGGGLSLARPRSIDWGSVTSGLGDWLKHGGVGTIGATIKGYSDIRRQNSRDRLDNEEFGEGRRMDDENLKQRALLNAERARKLQLEEEDRLREHGREDFVNKRRDELYNSGAPLRELGTAGMLNTARVNLGPEFDALNRSNPYWPKGGR